MNIKHHTKRRGKNPKQLFIVATIAAAAVFGAATYFVTNSSKDLLVAKVNNQKIYKSQVEKKLHDIFDGQNQNLKTPELEKLPKEVLEILVKEVYLDKELASRAEKSKAVYTQEVKDQINDLKNKILRQAYIDSLVKSEITDEKINDKYLELTKELDGKKEYSVSHILVKNKEQAEKIIKELEGKKVSPNKFEELAKKYSLDQETSAKGGDLGYVLEDNMVKEISEAISNLKKNEVSKPIQTKFGWHVIKYTDVRDAKPLPFESVKDNIKDQLVQDRVNEINAKITKNAKVKILIELKEEDASAAKKPEEASPQATEPQEAVVQEDLKPEVQLEPAGKNAEKVEEIKSEDEVVAPASEEKKVVKEVKTEKEKPAKAKAAKTKNKSDAKHKKDKPKHKAE